LQSLFGQDCRDHPNAGDVGAGFVIAPQSTWGERGNYHSSAADYLNYPSNLPQGPSPGPFGFSGEPVMTKRKNKSTKSTVKATRRTMGNPGTRSRQVIS